MSYMPVMANLAINYTTYPKDLIIYLGYMISQKMWMRQNAKERV